LPDVDIIAPALTTEVLGEGTKTALSAFDYLIRF